MRTSSDHIIRVTQSIERSLSLPPTVAGIKLKSHREIAARLEVNPSWVRLALERLEKKGILTRRPRVGTFVRRVPHRSQVAQEVEALDPEILFKDRPDEVKVSQRPLQDAQLQIGFWGKLESRTEIDQKILSGIARAVNIRGHKMVVHTGFQEKTTSDPFVRQSWQRRMITDPCDGYLVVSEWADLFHETFPDHSIPAVHFLPGCTDIIYTPTIMLDTHEAVRRAVRLFVQTGLTRIAHVGLLRWSGKQPEEYIYRATMQELGIEYDASLICELGVGHGMEAIRSLLARSDPPEALYVSDDNLLPGIAEALRMDKVVVGRDIAIITLSNTGFALPPQHNWSRLEFDRQRFGEILVDHLLSELMGAEPQQESVSILAEWKPGDTHMTAKTRNLGTTPYRML